MGCTRHREIVSLYTKQRNEKLEQKKMREREGKNNKWKKSKQVRLHTLLNDKNNNTGIMIEE